MLTKRTNILFDKDLWEKLAALAKKRKTSVGELTRKAVKNAYFSDEELIQEDRKRAVEAILRFRETHGKTLGKGTDSTEIIRKMRDERTKHLLGLIENPSK